ncbi:MAG: response regulator [Candidatus Paceibacterota bacterium]
MFEDEMESPLRVLVVDDDRGLLVLVSRALRPPSFAVDTVANFREARELLALNSYDFLVFDQNIPGDQLGTEVLAEMRAAGDYRPILIHSDDERILPLVREARGIYVRKDFGFEPLKWALQSFEL